MPITWNTPQPNTGGIKWDNTSDSLLTQAPKQSLSDKIWSGLASFQDKVGLTAAGNAMTGAIKSGADEFTQATSAPNPLEMAKHGLNVAGDVAGSIVSSSGAPMMKAVNAVISNKQESGIADQPGFQAIASSPYSVVSELMNHVDTLSTKLGEAGVKHPDIANALKSIFNIGSLFLGVEGARNPPASLSETVGALKSDVAAGAGKVKELIKGTPEQQAAKLYESALKDATPDYNSLTKIQKQKLNSAPPIEGMPRVQEGGVIKGRTITPTALEEEAATELSKVNGYNPNATALEKQHLLQGEIAKRGSALSESLRNEKVIVPKQEVVSAVVKAINEVPEESLLLQKSDAVIKNYMRVVRNAVSQNDGTLEGVLNVRKTMDMAYENARGKQAWGSDKMAALDDVHTAGRDTLTQYLIDHAQTTDVKASLRSQWNLYRALDQIAPKAAREAGTSLGRFAQKHPIITETAKMGIRGVGLGAGIHLVP